MRELISVIVPVYKVEKYLERCVFSILGSTYPVLEIILVDDGSPDHCPEICDRFASEHHQIKVIHKKNGGVSSARNAALDVASGEYIVFVDSDDWIDPDMIEVLYRAVEDAGADFSVIHCKTESKYSVTLTSCKYERDSLFIMNRQNALKEMCLGRKFEGHSCGKLIKKSLFESIRYPEDITICEDMVVVTKLILKAKKVVYYPYDGYHYYQRADSALHALAKESDWTVLDACQEMYSLIKNQGPNVMPYFEFLFVSQSLILAMRLNAAGKLDSKSYKRLKDTMKTYWNERSVQFCSKGTKIRCNMFLLGKTAFTLCNWALRNSRRFRS